MRKISFKQWIKAEYETPEDESKKIKKPGTGVYTDEFLGEGLFHGFVAETLEGSNGFGNTTMALIELEDGTITKSWPEHVKFIDKE